MHQVHLADQLYQQAQRRAIEAGFTSIDEYVADVIAQDLVLRAENLDHVFTPDVIRELDRASEVATGGGKTYSSDELKEHFRRRSEAWRANQTNR